jgi:hypothetical protein
LAIVSHPTQSGRSIPAGPHRRANGAVKRMTRMAMQVEERRVTASGRAGSQSGIVSHVKTLIGLV